MALMLLIILSTGTARGALPAVQRSVETYRMPDVVLVDQNGDEIHLTEFLQTEKPVLVDFIYATCTTICPVLSAGYSHLQRKLDDNSEAVRLVSFSIDPEHDKPQIMAEYLERYQGKKGWSFLTGSREDIDAVMHAFDAYVSNKMSHYPLTLIKVPGQNQWVRLYGLVGTRQLIGEVEKLYGPLPVSD